MTLQAADPDAPPSTVTYSLEGTIPPGATINANSGLITWPTTEANGPSTNIFTVRATENNAATLSDTRSFSVAVLELNQAPMITAISDRTVNDGQLVSFRVDARDNDVPSQTLSYSLQGALAGASIASDGTFIWPVPFDFAASTNDITVVVTDNGPGNLTANATFKIIVQRSVHVAINEVMALPAVANGQFVELHNASGTTSWNISGWRLVGKAMSVHFTCGNCFGPRCVPERGAESNNVSVSVRRDTPGRWRLDREFAGE